MRMAVQRQIIAALSTIRLRCGRTAAAMQYRWRRGNQCRLGAASGTHKARGPVKTRRTDASILSLQQVNKLDRLNYSALQLFCVERKPVTKTD